VKLENILLPVGILAVVAIARYAQGIVTNEIAAVTNGISDPPLKGIYSVAE